jgi:hypothetical protein
MPIFGGSRRERVKQTKFIKKTLKTCGKFYKAAPNGKRKEKTKTHTK